MKRLLLIFSLLATLSACVKEKEPEIRTVYITQEKAATPAPTVLSNLLPDMALVADAFDRYETAKKRGESFNLWTNGISFFGQLFLHHNRFFGANISTQLKCFNLFFKTAGHTHTVLNGMKKNEWHIAKGFSALSTALYMPECYLMFQKYDWSKNIQEVTKNISTDYHPSGIFDRIQKATKDAYFYY